MSSSYPNYHTHTENGKRGDKGQKGVSGEKGDAGINSHITEILFAFSNKTPADLFENTYVAGWDAPGSPLKTLTVRPGQSFVYTVDNSIWTYLPQANTAGWVQTGTVNADIYTTPGEKGAPGDIGMIGPKGDLGNKGEVGEKGVPGLAASKGEQGLKGETGPRGEKGEKGDRGETGLTGAKGEQGETGAQGEDGFPGTNGADGANGADGVDGQKGEPGVDGVTPGIDTVPVMLVSYDPIADLIRSKFNLDTITKLGTGHYRFRIKDKTRGSEMAATVATGLSLSGTPVLCYVVRQTARVVEVKTCDISGTLVDTTMNVVMFNPST